MPPDPTSAERAVIGSIVVSGGSVLSELSIEPSDFKDPALAGMFSLLRRMHSNEKVIDVLTVCDAVATCGDEVITKRIRDVDVHQMVADTPSAASVTAYEAIVQRAATVRRLQGVTHRLREISETDMGPDELVEKAREAVDDVDLHIRTHSKPISEDVEDAIDALEKPQEKSPTPWPELDDLIGGFVPGRLYIVGARPAVGKSVVALQCALAMAKHGAVAYSSLEMATSEVIHRGISMHAKLSVRRLTSGQMTNSEWEKVGKAMEWLKTRPVHIDDRSSVTMSQVRQFARNVQRTQPLAGVVLDYLQLMRTEAGDKRPRQEVVAEYSRQLKIMARELEVPVIALSQLNRASTQRGDGKPQMSDLRESGAVEQDSDVVILLHRDLDDKDKAKTLGVNVAKNRQGETGRFDLDFIGVFSEARSRRF